MRKFAAPMIKGLIFVLVTGLATTVLALSISNTGVGDTIGYSARFSDATQLNPGDDVRISGVRVGQVDELEIVDQNLALVHFSADRNWELPADVTATLKYRNMIGQRYLALERGPDPSNRKLEQGAEIPLERTRPALDLTDLFNGFKPLFQALSPKDVNQLSGEIVQVLQGEGGTVESLLAHTASLTDTLASKDRVIGQVITNLNSVLETINNEGDRLSTLISTLQRLVSGLAEDRTAIGDSVEGMARLTESTAGLLNSARRPLKNSIAGLRRLSGNLVTGSGELNRFLTLLPEKFDAIAKISSYGSWMNFYLCSATLQTNPPRGIPITQPRCQR
ncbi:MAG: MCE family protein [Pseudonocardiaceae bacterium]|nr:MCE family protein [Pseudonocardiaceae bacterium]